MGATLTSAGVGAAAGVLIAFSFTMSPPLTLLPPRPSDANGNPSLHRNTEVVVASADEFDGHWQAASEDIPPIPTSNVKDPLDLQDTNRLPVMAMVPSQEPQAEPDDLASVAKPSKELPVALVVPKPPVRPSDVCARNGLRRIDYTRNHHRYWRCLHGQRASSNRRTVSAATPVSNREPSGKEQQSFYGVLRGLFFRSSFSLPSASARVGE
jgi:hypothetical protein